MIDLSNIIKEAVNSVCKTAEFIYVLVANDTIIIDAADTTLSIVPIGMETGVYTGFSYPGDYTISNRDIFNHVVSLWEQYDQISKNSVVEGSIPDLRIIPEYEQLLAMKASDGAGVFRMPGNELDQNFVLYVFTGLPVINKPDKVGIIVKRIDRGNLLMEYHIFKKKLNCEVVTYFRTCDMNRQLMEEQFKVY